MGSATSEKPFVYSGTRDLDMVCISTWRKPASFDQQSRPQSERLFSRIFALPDAPGADSSFCAPRSAPWISTTLSSGKTSRAAVEHFWSRTHARGFSCTASTRRLVYWATPSYLLTGGMPVWPASLSMRCYGRLLSSFMYSSQNQKNILIEYSNCLHWSILTIFFCVPKLFCQYNIQWAAVLIWFVHNIQS